MAEALVNLTAFLMRMSANKDETVAEPIDGRCFRRVVASPGSGTRSWFGKSAFPLNFKRQTRSMLGLTSPPTLHSSVRTSATSMWK